jgi:hypothetical protein
VIHFWLTNLNSIGKKNKMIACCLLECISLIFIFNALTSKISLELDLIYDLHSNTGSSNIPSTIKSNFYLRNTRNLQTFLNPLMKTKLIYYRFIYKMSNLIIFKYFESNSLEFIVKFENINIYSTFKSFLIFLLQCSSHGN